jgi:hypothetical protein
MVLLLPAVSGKCERQKLAINSTECKGMFYENMNRVHILTNKTCQLLRDQHLISPANHEAQYCETVPLTLIRMTVRKCVAMRQQSLYDLPIVQWLVGFLV